MKRSINPEMVIAVSAVIVSVCALVVSIYEASLMREQQRSSVWPYVYVWLSYDAEGFAVIAENRGTGPARITAMEVTVDDQVVKSWPALVDQLLGPGHHVDYSIMRSNTLNGTVMPAGYRTTVFGVPWNEETRRLVEGFEQRIGYRLCYCSVFDECWTISDEKPQPAPGECIVNPERAFEN